jgi:hypothetical protein
LINRFGLPLLVTVAQLCAAALALGRPDPTGAAAFLAGGLPTAEEAIAALGLLVWAIVLVAAAWTISSLAWELGHRAVAHRRFREGSALATGCLILVAGAFHHVTDHAALSGGSVQEAQSILGR